MSSAEEKLRMEEKYACEGLKLTGPGWAELDKVKQKLTDECMDLVKKNAKLEAIVAEQQRRLAQGARDQTQSKDQSAADTYTEADG
jgi:hypothetical protein